jgi:hypothetical protein
MIARQGLKPSQPKLNNSEFLHAFMREVFSDLDFEVQYVEQYADCCVGTARYERSTLVSWDFLLGRDMNLVISPSINAMKLCEPNMLHINLYEPGSLERVHQIFAGYQDDRLQYMVL